MPQERAHPCVAVSLVLLLTCCCLPLVQCLSPITLAATLSGPIVAVGNAQTQSALAVLDILTELAFTTSGNSTLLRPVFMRVNLLDGDVLDIPFLTLVPVPYLVVGDVMTTFAVDITDTTTTMITGSTAPNTVTSQAVYGYLAAQGGSGETTVRKHTMTGKVVASMVEIDSITSLLEVLAEALRQSDPNP